MKHSKANVTGAETFSQTCMSTFTEKGFECKDRANFLQLYWNVVYRSGHPSQGRKLFVQECNKSSPELFLDWWMSYRGDVK